MRYERDVDALFAMADEALAENRYEEGKAMLEEILMIDPTYGRAYNHLGWFYMTKIDNAKKAESLFLLAIRHSPDYPAPYLHLGRLYMQLRRHSEAIGTLTRGMGVPGIDLASVYDLMAGVYELRGEYRTSYRYLKRALAETNATLMRDYLKGEIKRVRSRCGVLSAFALMF